MRCTTYRPRGALDDCCGATAPIAALWPLACVLRWHPATTTANLKSPLAGRRGSGASSLSPPC